MGRRAKSEHLIFGSLVRLLQLHTHRPFCTRWRGKSWKKVSPSNTNNSKSKQLTMLSIIKQLHRGQFYRRPTRMVVAQSFLRRADGRNISCASHHLSSVTASGSSTIQYRPRGNRNLQPSVCINGCNISSTIQRLWSSTKSGEDNKQPITKPKKITTISISAKKRRNKKITMVTAYDYPSAVHVDRAGIDIVLVGDSCAMVELGFETTQVCVCVCCVCVLLCFG